jgi:uncharacterized membrane protein YkvA (DUF1232 family)
VILGEVSVIERWKSQVKDLRNETYALYLAYKDPRVPWYAKVFIALIAGYAISPIDLIPDFIPVLGYLDDFILIPLGITLALKMMPKTVLEECREEAQKALSQDMPRNWVVGVVVITIWLVLIALVTITVLRTIS